MSLAEKLPRSDQPIRFGDVGVSTEVDNILRLALRDPGLRRPDDRDPAPSGQNFTASHDLLDRAAATMDALRQRCDHLEHSLAMEGERFRSELAIAHKQAREWERCASTVKAQLGDYEPVLAELQLRVDTATARAEVAEARLVVAEREAAKAIGQARLLHDKIMEAFGPSF